ncbi:MAG: hypothetical protein RQ763_09900 [Sulfurimonas sp.]|uniref:hypothetical protein n=1 Tax=Sulfurimonas sp. TaxID=2022749 RepID=UPI0028CC7945|nr:hypothetical protein [Sulfurimonas sp.]MDT8339503.1 hypothetical protein [Sulfurimonas sp.]
MKKFNLFKEIITVDKNSLQEAIDAKKTFGIDINGRVCNEPFTTDDILIYIGTPNANVALSEALGSKYQVVEDDNRVLIKAFSNWQEIIGFNTIRATYDDTTADGVDEFSTKEMEDIGWHAAEFNINYRTLVELLEKECDGTLICIEQEDPYQFSGLGFVSNLEDARDTLFNYCQTEVKRLITEDEDFAKESLNDDELEAAEFFKAL